MVQRKPTAEEIGRVIAELEEIFDRHDEAIKRARRDADAALRNFSEVVKRGEER